MVHELPPAILPPEQVRVGHEIGRWDTAREHCALEAPLRMWSEMRGNASVCICHATSRLDVDGLLLGVVCCLLVGGAPRRVFCLPLLRRSRLAWREDVIPVPREAESTPSPPPSPSLGIARPRIRPCLYRCLCWSRPFVFPWKRWINRVSAHDSPEGPMHSLLVSAHVP